LQAGRAHRFELPPFAVVTLNVDRA
jgi:hypothetical protein